MNDAKTVTLLRDILDFLGTVTTIYGRQQDRLCHRIRSAIESTPAARPADELQHLREFADTVGIIEEGSSSDGFVREEVRKALANLKWTMETSQETERQSYLRTIAELEGQLAAARPADAGLCHCQLRDRQWNPQTGRCETCSCAYDRRRGSGIVEPPPALAAARPADDAEPAGWRPIETAPRDGSQILLWSDNSRYYDIGYWDTNHWVATTRELPTHWQPLPEPPASACEEGDDDPYCDVCMELHEPPACTEKPASA